MSGGLRKLISWLWSAPAATAPLALESAEAAEPSVLRPQEEAWLEALGAEVAEGRRADTVGSAEFWERIDALWNKGHERLATDWIRKFVAAPATPEATRTELRAKLVELLIDLGEEKAAVPELDKLTAAEPHALRAHYLLGEHFRKTGDERRALRHYEAVLARDLDYPNVRARAQRLRAAQGETAAADIGATFAGGDAAGAGAGSRYRLVRELGRGGTGVVYLARDAELERDVAVKLLHPHLAAADSADALARFFDEARAAASLRHPNIVAILDLDERARRLVMELAAGGTLRAVLRERGPRPLRRALERHAQIVSALVAAHRRGIVHRDLKPANLMFRRDADEAGAEVVLADFGVAHLPGADGAPPAERAGKAEAVGTLAYMAPEQRRGADADPRSDLYAAGVVLFEMLTGRVPWPRDVLLSGVRRAGDFRLPEQILAGVPAPIARALTEHLDALGAPDPAGRPRSEEAAAAAGELRDLAVAAAHDAAWLTGEP